MKIINFFPDPVIPYTFKDVYPPSDDTYLIIDYLKKNEFSKLFLMGTASLKEEFLKEYSFREERLKDPLFVPEMLNLMEEIKKNKH